MPKALAEVLRPNEIELYRLDGAPSHLIRAVILVLFVWASIFCSTRILVGLIFGTGISFGWGWDAGIMVAVTCYQLFGLWQLYRDRVIITDQRVLYLMGGDGRKAEFIDYPDVASFGSLSSGVGASGIRICSKDSRRLHATVLNNTCVILKELAQKTGIHPDPEKTAKVSLLEWTAIGIVLACVTGTIYVAYVLSYPFLGDGVCAILHGVFTYQSLLSLGLLAAAVLVASLVACICIAFATRLVLSYDELLSALRGNSWYNEFLASRGAAKCYARMVLSLLRVLYCREIRPDGSGQAPFS